MDAVYWWNFWVSLNISDIKMVPNRRQSYQEGKVNIKPVQMISAYIDAFHCNCYLPHFVYEFQAAISDWTGGMRPEILRYGKVFKK